MTETPPKDPLDWNVDRVCQELCFPGAQWTTDPIALQSLLYENLMDGETLLTYELEFSKTELMVCLQIVAARHRSKLSQKIRELQSRSPGFHRWKKSFSLEHALDRSSLADTAISPNTTRQEPSLPEGKPCNENVLASGDQAQHDTSKASEPSKERRRLIPTFVGNISSNTSNLQTSNFQVPEANADTVGHPPSEDKSDQEPPTAYLGTKVVRLSNIMLMDTEYESDSGSDTFQSVATTIRPRGRVKAVYSMLRKNVLKSNKVVRKKQTGLGGVVNPVEGDQLVNFDDLESLDEETLREIAADEAEDQQASFSCLDSETVESIINQEIDNIKNRWETKKLPKHERRAFSQWAHARKHGLLRQRAFEARKEENYYRARLDTLTRDLRSLPWATEEDLRMQTRCIEQTVEDKLLREWLTKLFTRRTSPAKPPPVHRKASVGQKKVFVHKDELSSSDESDFIVADEDNHLIHESSSRLSLVAENTDIQVSTIQTQSRREPKAELINSPAISLIDLTLLSDVEMEEPKEQIVSLKQSTDVEMKEPEELLVPKQLEPFSPDVISEIRNTPWRTWAKQKDRFRLAISLLWKLTFVRREAVFALLTGSDIDVIWAQLLDNTSERFNADGECSETDAAFDLAIVYVGFLKCRYYNEKKIAKIGKIRKKIMDWLQESQESFPAFCAFLISLQDGFPKKHQIARPDAYDDELLGSDEWANSSNAKKKKRKEIILDRGAVALREREMERLEEQEKRRKELRTNMLDREGLNGTSTNNLAHFIINELKDAKDAFINVHAKIAPKIKEHQLEGVRFLWNHIVRDSSERQGCLLAHTMGLGKTMQTITFLVALRESACSTDPAVLNQIPQDLRKWNVLVLCPAGLVENWKDEFLIWAPKDLMGQIHTIEAAQTPHERNANARTWSAEGGVLIIGYNMFKSEFQKNDASLATIDRILVDKATIVIADEAHCLKNPNAKISKLASQMKASSRIALTGSPLANNVEEYYFLIDWVAPNFLGPQQEFREIFAGPIHQGLYRDSSEYDKRRAIKLLQVLKETAAPKVHRATIKSCLKDDLPPKQEFVISVPPTAMQWELYDIYMSSTATTVDNMSPTGLFTVLNQLALICAHPAVYRKKIIDIRSKLSVGRDSAKFPLETIPKILKVTGEENLERIELSNKVELLNEILNEAKQLNDKVLVFSQSIYTLDYLGSLFKKQGRRFCRLDGSTNIAKRQEMIKDFNAGVDEVYLISTAAGGVGLNIHGANRVVIFDFKWNPVQDQQAIGRAYRIGQKKPVFVYRFVVAGTYEDDLHNKTVFKMQLASRVVDQKNPISWSKRNKRLIHPINIVDASSARFDFRGKDRILDHLLDHNEGRAILSVMSSDAFEEEDETATLTAEELKETTGMVERERLRTKDPAEYSRLIEVQRQASYHRPSSNIATSKPNADAFTPRPTHAFQPRALVGFAANERAMEPLQARPLPITGANTFFGSSQPAFTNSNSHVVPGNNHSRPMAEACRRDARSGFKDKLTFTLKQVARAHSMDAVHAEEITASICARIEAAWEGETRGIASESLRWSLLDRNLDNNKFVLAIASGQVTPEFLANAEEGDLKVRMQSLDIMPDEIMLQQMKAGGRPKDPEVRRERHDECDLF